MKIIIVGAIVLLCVAGFVYFYSYEGGRGNVYTIKLTEDGFAPSAITIAKGDTVTFTTARDKPFWPASDLHPTHGIYSEFDPKQPIDPDKSWSFRFDKKGEWRFHDHLAPLFRGVIIVIVQDSGKDFSLKGNMDECSSDQDAGQKVQCWEALLLKTLKENGVDSAYRIVANAYETDEDFRDNCHGLVHILGQAAYQKFQNNENQGIAGISSKTSYCNYGFFHGFMESLIHNEGNSSIAKVREFCNALNRELTGSNSISSFWTHCIHGIGHGFTDASDSRAWGNTDAIINPGLSLCEKVTINEYEKQLCGSGVFNSLFGSIYTNSKYRLSFDKQDPQAICREQKTSYFKAGCYNESITLLMDLTGNNVREAARFIERMAEREYQAGAIDELETYAVKFNLGQNRDYDGIRICQSLQKGLSAPCVAGIVAGFMEWGTPGKEDGQALAICNSSLITHEERAACFERVLWLSSLRYPIEKQTAICASVGKQYHNHCPT